MASKETVLVVEDDASIRSGLELNLRLEGYHVLLAADLEQGQELARSEAPELILLDVMLPGGRSGLDLLSALRREGREVQVILLTALGQEQDKVRGLKLGADDYITKPFSVAELMARIDAALRRTRRAKEQQDRELLTFADYQIDRRKRDVHRGREVVRLTAKEYDLLIVLAESPGRVFSREQLLQRVWGYDYEGTSRTVDNFIRSLRLKLERDPSDPRHLHTVHGVGYRFEG